MNKYHELVFLIKILMVWLKILLGDYFENFIISQVKTGKFSSASEVVRAALRLFEEEEIKKAELIKELVKGEKSGFVENFDRNTFLESLHKKYQE